MKQLHMETLLALAWRD